MPDGAPINRGRPKGSKNHHVKVPQRLCAPLVITPEKLPHTVQQLVPPGWQIINHRNKQHAGIVGNERANCVSLQAPDPYSGGAAQYWVTLDLHRRVFALGPAKPAFGPDTQGVGGKYRDMKVGWLWHMTLDAIEFLQAWVDSHYISRDGLVTGSTTVLGLAARARALAQAADGAEPEEEQLW